VRVGVIIAFQVKLFQGNGRAAAYRFIEEGARVFAVDLSESALTETLERIAPLGGEIATHICDVTDGASVAEMMASCIERFGRLDVLINNVGGSAPGGPVELSEEDWDGQIDFNGIFSKLTQYGFDGWAVLEWECCLKHPEDGAAEGAPFITDHIIHVTDRAFDDFAGGETDLDQIRKTLGI